MQDRRRLIRHRTFKVGGITLKCGGIIDCRVRNLSPIGACLEVESHIGIPDDFALLIDHGHLKQTCHVVWRTGPRLGVAFCG